MFPHYFVQHAIHVCILRIYTTNRTRLRVCVILHSSREPSDQTGCRPLTKTMSIAGLLEIEVYYTSYT